MQLSAAGPTLNHDLVWPKLAPSNLPHSGAEPGSQEEELHIKAGFGTVEQIVNMNLENMAKAASVSSRVRWWRKKHNIGVVRCLVTAFTHACVRQGGPPWLT